MVESIVGIKGKFLEYKGKPLVRQGNELYYGDMSDKFILFLMIMSYKKDEKLNVQFPDKIMIQIIPTNGSQEVKKQGGANGLFEALDLGSAWLERFNRV